MMSRERALTPRGYRPSAYEEGTKYQMCCTSRKVYSVR
jgi:hypothetical protein